MRKEDDKEKVDDDADDEAGKMARQRPAKHLDSISPASSQPYDATTQTARGTYPVPLSPTNHLPTKIPSASCQTWSDLRISETLLYKTTQKPIHQHDIANCESQAVCRGLSASRQQQKR